MKKIVLLFAIMLLALPVYAADITNLKDAMTAREDSPVALEGTIIGIVDSDDGEYIFQDAHAVVKIDISRSAAGYNSLKVNDKIKLTGKVDVNNGMKNEIEIEAFSFQKI